MPDGKKHPKYKDLTGQRFGMLTAIQPSHSDGKKWLWEFRCDCGNTLVRYPTEVNKTIKAGGVASCGCNTNTAISQANSTHGMTSHPVYSVWRSMCDRCKLPSHQAWKNYGGRGISVCERWTQSFEAFWEDMGPTYERGLTLDRINNDGDYTPENCQWVDWHVQASNKRNSLPVDIRKAKQLTQISDSTLRYRWERRLSMTSSTPDPDRASWSLVMKDRSSFTTAPKRSIAKPSSSKHC